MFHPYQLITVRSNLYNIRFSFVFVRFCFFMKEYAFFRPHFYVHIRAKHSVWQLHIDKIFAKKFFCKKILSKNDENDVLK